ncbi:Glutathionylspermidine synthase Gsp [Helicobacter sp. NHP19-012]|uniref:Glutathionylspermidine synthase Gsp n=1 Tax=Helicobacter gastrofelis TaxID=2849642 RepID=A0ABM7SD14_9HELI|nr:MULTISPECIES: glutathionylspermidine synthase family protein [unclassified Helicobacter]BCZ18596.1 Glutathionylspermidine synthase Gsp [Helicobacter sp. NHP19-012]GMB95868.1 Glutathionylspermidine synthase Gsp [Helicobacter sp. NHP22-001]
MQVKTLNPLSKQALEEIGLEWHTDPDNTDYISTDLITINQAQADAYYGACNELYDMCVETAQMVIDQERFFELDIPNSIVPMIKQSWENDIHWHIYGRFDLAGGLEGQPIKLLEFNADTPTMLYESALVQWALLKHNGFNAELQFNNIFEALGENFKRLVTLQEDTSAFSQEYEGWKILFSCVQGSSEEERTTRFLQECAKSAGFNTQFGYIDKVEFNAETGVFYEGVNYEFLFKLIPWENIAIDEPELALLMQGMMENENTIFLNPAYTLIFQSKRFLKLLWERYPNHPLLLETSYEPLRNKKQVRKVAFGREGANTQILNPDLSVVYETKGIYGNHKPIYQEFAPLNKVGEFYYQPNVFYAYEACGLGFRKGGLVMDNFSKFVSHIIQ